MQPFTERKFVPGNFGYAVRKGMRCANCGREK